MKKKTQQTQDDSKENSLLTDQIVNRVIVSVKQPSFYQDRAKRALRLHEEITIMGFGNHMSAACTIVETLKRQKIAKIHKIETVMDTPLLNTANHVSFARPLPKIVIHLRRGELALYISGYYQRKMIDLFETNDKNASGRLTYEQVHSLNLQNAFHATDEAKKEALKEIHGKSSISLPEFIRFASYCINPRLRDDEFQKTLETSYGIRGTHQGDKNDDDNADSEHDDNVANTKSNDHPQNEQNQHVNN